MTIREILLLRIKGLGVKQYEVARLAGMQPQNLSAFFKGNRNLPYPLLEKVCAVMGLTLDSVNKCYK